MYAWLGMYHSLILAISDHLNSLTVDEYSVVNPDFNLWKETIHALCFFSK